jgi:hypothetical protein
MQTLPDETPVISTVDDRRWLLPKFVMEHSVDTFSSEEDGYNNSSEVAVNGAFASNQLSLDCMQGDKYSNEQQCDVFLQQRQTMEEEVDSSSLPSSYVVWSMPSPPFDDVHPVHSSIFVSPNVEAGATSSVAAVTKLSTSEIGDDGRTSSVASPVTAASSSSISSTFEDLQFLEFHNPVFIAENRDAVAWLHSNVVAPDSSAASITSQHPANLFCGATCTGSDVRLADRIPAQADIFRWTDIDSHCPLVGRLLAGDGISSSRLPQLDHEMVSDFFASVEDNASPSFSGNYHHALTASNYLRQQ